MNERTEFKMPCRMEEMEESNGRAQHEPRSPASFVHWPTCQIPPYMPIFVELTISLALHSYDLLGLLIPPFAQI
jgi:hypothetical protein